MKWHDSLPLALVICTRPWPWLTFSFADSICLFSHCDTRIQHPASSIPHPASCILHPASRILHYPWRIDIDIGIGFGLGPLIASQWNQVVEPGFFPNTIIDQPLSYLAFGLTRGPYFPNPSFQVGANKPRFIAVTSPCLQPGIHLLSSISFK